MFGDESSHLITAICRLVCQFETYGILYKNDVREVGPGKEVLGGDGQGVGPRDP